MSSEVKDTWVRGPNLPPTSCDFGQGPSPFLAPVYLLQYGDNNGTYTIKILHIKDNICKAQCLAYGQYSFLAVIFPKAYQVVFFIRDYKDLRKSKPEFHCKQTETKDINFRLGNRSGVHFLFIIMLPSSRHFELPKDINPP